MKSIKKLLILLAVLCLCLTGCQGNKPSEDPAPEPELTPAEISEKAMDNFLTKIKDGKYTIESNFLKINVYSRDLVWFDYKDEAYNDFAAMSVKNEAFQGFLRNGGLENIVFLGEEQAIDAADSRLPGYLLNEEVSQGNIYNLFYNQTDAPLTFLSREEIVKRFLLSYAGYGEMAVSQMEDVYLEMDNINPTVVHMKAVMNDNPVTRISYDDIDVVITFGEAEGNAAAEAWMKSPVYPEPRTAWTEGDLFILNSIFMPGYGEQAVPFPTFASYAMTMDQDYLMTDMTTIRDSHATEQDLADYIELLKKEGFEEAKAVAEDGSEKTVYRRLLRDEYKCYSEIAPSFDNGVNLVTKKYYAYPEYYGLDEINKVVTGLGFVELPASTNFVELKGTDRAVALTESWLYFFDYNANLYVDINFEDEDKMNEYLAAYEAALQDAGFTPVYEGDTEEMSYLAAPQGRANFRYLMTGDNKVSLLYRSEKTLPAEEAEKRIAEAGFPEIDLNDPLTCRDLAKFAKVQYGRDYKLYLAFDQTFATMEEAEAFLNAYEEKLTAAGFERTNPSVVGSLKQVAIYNEEKGMLMGIDLFEQKDNVQINVDFTVE